MWRVWIELLEQQNHTLTLYMWRNEWNRKLIKDALSNIYIIRPWDHGIWCHNIWQPSKPNSNDFPQFVVRTCVSILESNEMIQNFIVVIWEGAYIYIYTHTIDLFYF